MARLSLRAKLLVGLFFILAPVLGLLFASYRASYDMRARAVLSDQMSTASAVSALVDATFNEAAAVGRAVAENAAVRSLDVAAEDSYLSGLATSYPQYENIAVFDAQGENVAAMMPYRPGEERISIADRPYFQQVMATNDAVVSPVVTSRRTGQAAVVVAVPLRNDTGRPSGAVNVVLRLDYYAQRLEPLRLSAGQAFFVVDPTGRLAYHSSVSSLPWDRRDFSTLPLVASALRGETASSTSFDSPLGDERAAVLLPTPQHHWVVGVTIPVRQAFAGVQDLRRAQILGFAAVAAFSLALALILSQYVMRPVKILVEQAKAIGSGDLTRRVSIRTGDELQRLGTAFNNMAGRLHETMLQLEHTNSELTAVLDAAESGIVMVDSLGMVRFLNRTAAQWFGVSPEDVVDGPKEVLIAAEKTCVESPLEFVARLDQVYAKPDLVAEDELEIVRPLARTLRRYSAPVYTTDGAILGRIHVYSDVTERRRLERLRDEFLSVAAHELKTPVTTVKGYAQLLLQWTPQGHEPREGKALKAISRQSDRIDRLVKDLLEISRMQMGPLELTIRDADLSGIAARVAERCFSQTLKHRVVLRRDGPLPVKVDVQRLEEALANLLENAIKYSPEGGEVTIEVSALDGEALVAVRDHGVGIPTAMQPHIFERFFRAHTHTPFDYGGMGVGLYMTKQIVEQHGGRIWFESEEGTGSTFSFALPLTA